MSASSAYKRRFARNCDDATTTGFAFSEDHLVPWMRQTTPRWQHLRKYQNLTNMYLIVSSPSYNIAFREVTDRCGQLLAEPKIPIANHCWQCCIKIDIATPSSTLQVCSLEYLGVLDGRHPTPKVVCCDCMCPLVITMGCDVLGVFISPFHGEACEYFFVPPNTRWNM